MRTTKEMNATIDLLQKRVAELEAKIQPVKKLPVKQQKHSPFMQVAIKKIEEKYQRRGKA